ncbi:MAG: alpha-amylase family glycosyl hydrolase [Acidimicrobiales bacterium]
MSSTTGSDQVAWLHDAIGYEAYIRSFADSNGDGVGDLEGIRQHLDHLVTLGVNTLWITPFYPSPMADFGYDVADYCGVDPLFGTLDDVEKLTHDAHALGVRVLIDLVPNHCSSAHEWFRQAVSDPAGPYRDYFIWRDPAPNGGPPNNWISYFGGSAWSLDEPSGQYYLHLFLDEQPDLNWRCEALRDEFDAILRFWLDLGIDGFRIDVAQALMKDQQLRSNPQVAPWNPNDPLLQQWDAFEHLYDIAQPETAAIYRRWRKLVEPRGAVLIGETYVLNADHLARLLSGGGLHLGFWFRPMHVAWDVTQIRAVLREPLESVDDRRSIGWVQSSHDEVRSPTRFGGGDLGRRRSLALSTVLFCLPGVPFLYQGEELGLLESVVSAKFRADPVGADSSLSRDGARTPMTWTSGTAFGFSSNASTWLPQDGRTVEDAADYQQVHPDSWLRRYTDLITLRREQQDLRGADLEWLDDAAGNVLRFRRGSLVVAVNLGSSPEPAGVDGEVLFSTGARSGEMRVDSLLNPAEAVVLRR